MSIKSGHIPFLILAFVAAATLGVIGLKVERSIRAQLEMGFSGGRHLKCAIAVKEHDDTTRHVLLAGYIYAMLQNYASAEDSEISIVQQTKGENYIDSVRYGGYDVVVLPFVDSMVVEDMFLSRPVDSLLVFGFKQDRSKHEARFFEEWFDSYMSSPGFAKMRETFYMTKHPSRRKPADFVSPYDSLIRVYAAEIGWDWRLFAALIYQESKFRIDVTSRKGAKGLLQMKPKTAAAHGVTDLYSPEQSISAGADYLRRLQRLYRRRAKDRQELAKFTLAAYNAGEGRIRSCIVYADSLGLPCSTWDDMVGIISARREESRIDSVTIKSGTFRGYETIAYVDAVLSLYAEFQRICP